MKIDIYHSFNSDDYRDAWVFYTEAFRDLNTQAAQRHLMREEEFSDVCGDLAVEKHVARDEAGRMVGLAVITNQLDAWPLISPAYFELKWPDLYRLRKIWYAGFVCTNSGNGVFQALLESMTDGRRNDGIFVADYCSRRITGGIIDSVDATFRRITGRKPISAKLDSQEFWATDCR